MTPKRPSFQFYPEDWLNDLKLRQCRPASRGLWIDMLCLMHQGEPYGHLRTSAGDIGPDFLARVSGLTLRQVIAALHDLCRHDVFSKTEIGTIFSRRMVRDEQLRNARAQGGPRSLENPNVPKPKAVTHSGRQPEGYQEGPSEGYPSTPSFHPSFRGSPPSPSPSPSVDKELLLTGDPVSVPSLVENLPPHPEGNNRPSWQSGGSEHRTPYDLYQMQPSDEGTPSGNQAAQEGHTTGTRETQCKRIEVSQQGEKKVPRCPFPQDAFESFYQAYPRRVDRKVAERAYRKATKKHSHDAITTGLAKWKASPDWADPQFIPYPATFLNSERFLDEPTLNVRPPARAADNYSEADALRAADARKGMK